MRWTKANLVSVSVVNSLGRRARSKPWLPSERSVKRNARRRRRSRRESRRRRRDRKPRKTAQRCRRIKTILLMVRDFVILNFGLLFSEVVLLTVDCKC